MANIRVDLNGMLSDGQMVTFKAPCDCTEIEGIKVYYPKDGEIKSKVFTMKDSHGFDLAGVGNLFMAGAYVTVILNTTDGVAHLQNADTNKYIENKFGGVSFGIDGEGNYGYFGADGSLIPFKTVGAEVVDCGFDSLTTPTSYKAAFSLTGIEKGKYYFAPVSQSGANGRTLTVYVETDIKSYSEHSITAESTTQVLSFCEEIEVGDGGTITMYIKSSSSDNTARYHSYVLLR